MAGYAVLSASLIEATRSSSFWASRLMLYRLFHGNV